MGDSGDKLFVGIDAGGTKCRCRIETSNGILLGTGRSGAANLRLGMEQVEKSIIGAIEDALPDDRSLADLIVGVGIAGHAVPELREALENWQHPFHFLSATTDVETARIGAYGHEDGAVLIVGTGTCAQIRRDDRITTLGGFGFPAGDHASGAWIGLEACRHTILADEGMAEMDGLARTILEQSGGSAESLAEQVLNATPGEFGAFAPTVFEHAEAGESVANRIISAAAILIDQFIAQIAQEHNTPVTLVGGVAIRIVPWLSAGSRGAITRNGSSAMQGAIAFVKTEHAHRSRSASISSTSRRDPNDCNSH